MGSTVVMGIQDKVRVGQPMEAPVKVACMKKISPKKTKLCLIEVQLQICCDMLCRSVSGYANSKPGPCHFINGSRRAPVALASFPGSGNTWVRGLLEMATGVCTGG